MAPEQGCKGILVAGHIGNLIKVAGGIMNTHSRWADCRMEFLASAGSSGGPPGKQSRRLPEAMTTDDALCHAKRLERRMVMEQVIRPDTKIPRIPRRRGNGDRSGRFSNVYGILGQELILRMTF